MPEVGFVTVADVVCSTAPRSSAVEVATFVHALQLIVDRLLGVPPIYCRVGSIDPPAELTMTAVVSKLKDDDVPTPYTLAYQPLVASATAPARFEPPLFPVILQVIVSPAVTVIADEHFR